MTPNQTQGIGHQSYLPYTHYRAIESQIFVRFALQIAVFEIFHILGFPIDSHVKISRRHNIFFKTWPIAKKSDSLYSTMGHGYHR